MGFAGCTGGGFVVSSIGSFVLFSGFSEANITTFVIMYIIGNLMSLGGTLFLCGPKKQCVKMWDKSRRCSTLFYLSMLLVVFCVAITKQHIAIILSMLFVEILSAIWYSAAFIPYGRNMILGCLRGGPCGPLFKCYDSAAESCSKKCEGCCKSKNNSGSNDTWFGGETKKKESSWFGGGEEKKNSGGWFGGEEEKPKSGGWFGGDQK
jgi:hypothetical protein